jgi:tripartite ATP-independent transporter DctM subunit
MMTKDGRYPKGFAAALTAASATVGPIIPPSIPMVLYALVSGASIGALFMGGLLPGLFMAAALGTLVWYLAVRHDFPAEGRVAIRALPRLFVRAFLPLLTPVILLGGIYSGVFTPTEAAAVAAAYALLLTVFAYRDYGPKEFYRVLVETARESSVVLLLLASTYVFNYVITLEQVPQRIAAALATLDVSSTVLMLLIMVVFLLLGAFMDGAVILLVAVPLVLPTLIANDINLIHFGVVMSVNVMIGGLTPPFGLLLFVLNSLTDAPLRDIIRAVWPFIALLISCLVVMTVFPALVTWLPNLVGYR